MDIRIDTEGNARVTRRLPRIYRVSPYDRFQRFGRLFCEFRTRENRLIGTFDGNAAFETHRPEFGAVVTFRERPRVSPDALVPFASTTSGYSACVYVLELDADKCYVGITANVNLRMWQHASGTGSIFTRIFPPKRCSGGCIRARIFYPATAHTERIVSERLIKLRGARNVRGGPWCALFPEHVREAVRRAEGANALTSAIAETRRRAIRAALDAATAASVSAAEAMTAACIPLPEWRRDDRSTL